MTTLIVLFAVALIATFAGFFAPPRSVKVVTLLGMVVALLSLAFTWGDGATAFGGLYVADSFSQGFTLVMVVGAILALLADCDYFERKGWPAFEYYPLVAFAVLGGHVMASTPHLGVMIVGLEILSIPLYALAASRRDEAGYEASLKYFLLGAVAAAFFLYGIALYFGSTGSFTLGAAGSGLVFNAAVLMLLAGLSFKAALTPFHWWTPDVYQGSATPVTLFMATAVKAAAFAALARVVAAVGLGGPWVYAFGAMVLLTVFWGNLSAMVQGEAKRMLAYSSVAHAGYIAVALFGPNPAPAMGFYLLAYALSTGLAFAVLAELDEGGGVKLEGLAGLWGRSPLLGLAWTVALLSLAGLPPLVGFWGKYLVFVEAAKAGQYAMVALALFAAVIAAYYYLKLLAAALFGKPVKVEPVEMNGSSPLGIALATALVIVFGVLPGLAYGWFASASALIK
ncbi:NADH-quinone oxidoreductase subunit N [Oceanithermus sp.]